jgi:hypothetical protein
VEKVKSVDGDVDDLAEGEGTSQPASQFQLRTCLPPLFLNIFSVFSQYQDGRLNCHTGHQLEAFVAPSSQNKTISYPVNLYCFPAHQPVSYSNLSPEYPQIPHTLRKKSCHPGWQQFSRVAQLAASLYLERQRQAKQALDLSNGKRVKSTKSTKSPKQGGTGAAGRGALKHKCT